MLGVLEFLLHFEDLSLINFNFTWSKDWGFNESEVWFAIEINFRLRE